MYSLEDLLNTRGEDSVTSGSCKWLRKPRVDTEPCEVRKLIITKDKIAPVVKAKKRPYQWLQSKELDVRQNQKAATNEEIALFTSRMEDLTPESPIFPLLDKLYLTKKPSAPATSSTNASSVTSSSNQDKQSLSIMAQKITELLHLHKTLNPNELLAHLCFTDEEINIVNQTTIDQWKCKEWYIHKQGFLSASKCKSYCTRQNTLEKEKLDGFCKLAKETVTIKANKTASTMVNDSSSNPRGWGLINEENARKAYKNVQTHLHHNVNLQNCGFMISAAKPYMGASLDDVRSCACITGCQKVAVEYKCPWVHKDNDPKSAFLSKEIGGVMLNGKLYLQTTCKYYYQVQMQMYVSQLLSCDFVVWTTKGIQCATVPFDAKFMNGVILQLEMFWLKQVAPLLILEFQSLTEEDHCPKFEEVTAKVNVDWCEDNSEENRKKDLCELIHDAEELSKPLNPAIQINGVEIREYDLLSLTPGSMVNDVIANALLNEQLCQFPVIDCLFYSILCGEQEGAIVSDRQTRMVTAEKYFTKDHLAKDYVVIPVVRSLHWLLMVLTPWFRSE